MADLIVLGIVLLLVFAASLYIYKQKKKGVKCIGCSSAGACSGKCSCGCGNVDDRSQQKHSDKDCTAACCLNNIYRSAAVKESRERDSFFVQ